jgi:hypothetical protein
VGANVAFVELEAIDGANVVFPLLANDGINVAFPVITADGATVTFPLFTADGAKVVFPELTTVGTNVPDDGANVPSAATTDGAVVTAPGVALGTVVLVTIAEGGAVAVVEFMDELVVTPVAGDGVAATGVAGRAVALPAGTVGTGCAVVGSAVEAGGREVGPGVVGAAGIVGVETIGETVRSNVSPECRWKIDCPTSSLDKAHNRRRGCRNFRRCGSSTSAVGGGAGPDDESSCPAESPRSKSSTKQ